MKVTTETDCKRNVDTGRVGKEKVTQTPGMYALLYLHKRYDDLRNALKATFWSEPCTPDLHRKGKTAFKRGRWRVEVAVGGRGVPGFVSQAMVSPLLLLQQTVI